MGNVINFEAAKAAKAKLFQEEGGRAVIGVIKLIKEMLASEDREFFEEILVKQMEDLKREVIALYGEDTWNTWEQAAN